MTHIVYKVRFQNGVSIFVEVSFCFLKAIKHKLEALLKDINIDITSKRSFDVVMFTWKIFTPAYFLSKFYVSGNKGLYDQSLT